MNFVKTNNFLKEIQSSKNVICYFWSFQCPSCSTADFFLKKLENFFQELKILKVESERELDLVREFSIKSVPTFIFFQDSKVIKRIEGFNKQKEFEIEKIVRNL